MKNKMKGRISVFVLLIIMLLLISVNTGEAKKRKIKMNSEEIINVLKPGQWVKVKGMVQKDFSVLCREVKILTGDFLADDWEIVAVVQKIDKIKKVFELLHLPVTVQSDADFEPSSDTVAFRSFDDLKVGMLVELEGTYFDNGTFMAREIEDESHKLEEKPHVKDKIEVKGKIDTIDADNHTISLMGITFQITNKTKGKSVIR